jgi:hypothetical protein
MSHNASAESFDEACQRFSQFLGKNDYPEHLCWVEPQDAVWARSQLWVNGRSEKTAWRRASRQYADGIRTGLGVSLYAFAEFAGTTIATILVPQNEDAAQRCLMPRNSLKLSAAVKKLSARRVSNHLSWMILSMLYRTSTRSFWASYFDCS